MTLAGHVLAHIPHPTHLLESMMAHTPCGMVIAPSLQAVRQQPQAAHKLVLTQAFFFIFISSFVTYILENQRWFFSDFCHFSS